MTSLPACTIMITRNKNDDDDNNNNNNNNNEQGSGRRLCLKDVTAFSITSIRWQIIWFIFFVRCLIEDGHIICC